MIDEGAGFAGAAVWGAGQGPDYHDMLARIDLDTYTQLPWLPNTARFASPTCTSTASPHPYCASYQSPKRVLGRGIVSKGIHFQRRHGTRALSGYPQARTARSSRGIPTTSTDLAKPCYDFSDRWPQRIGYLQELTTLSQPAWTGASTKTDHEDG